MEFCARYKNKTKKPQFYSHTVITPAVWISSGKDWEDCPPQNTNSKNKSGMGSVLLFKASLPGSLKRRNQVLSWSKSDFHSESAHTEHWGTKPPNVPAPEMSQRNQKCWSWITPGSFPSLGSVPAQHWWFLQVPEPCRMMQRGGVGCVQTPKHSKGSHSTWLTWSTNSLSPMRKQKNSQCSSFQGIWLWHVAHSWKVPSEKMLRSYPKTKLGGKTPQDSLYIWEIIHMRGVHLSDYSRENAEIQCFTHSIRKM